MSFEGLAHPPNDSWAVAVYASPSDGEPLGAGVVIDDRRVLTCAHVVASQRDLWIAFPKAADISTRCHVDRIVLPVDDSLENDLGILVLKNRVPHSVTPALLRDPHPLSLIGRRWWAYGYPGGDVIGNAANGEIAEALDYGWILLRNSSHYRVEPGFSGGGDVRIWEPDAGAWQSLRDNELTSVRAVCVFRLDDRDLLAAGGGPGGVRVWDPATGELLSVLGDSPHWFAKMCVLSLGNRAFLAIGDTTDENVEIWNPATETCYRVIEGAGPVRAICAVPGSHDSLLAISTNNQAGVHIWDPWTGTRLSTLTDHMALVYSIHTFTLGGRRVLAFGSADHTIRIWDAAAATQRAVLRGHTDAVMTLCSFTVDDRIFLASGSGDWTIRIWDPATETSLLVIPVHHDVEDLAYIDGLLMAGLRAGLVAIRLDLDHLLGTR